MRTRTFRACVLSAIMASFGTPVSISAQAPVGTAAQQAAAAATPQVRRLTVDDAVRLAAENNLGIQIARVNPQLEDLNVVLARANWSPTFATTLTNGHNNSPSDNLISGAGIGSAIKSGRFLSNVGLQQVVPWGGGNYSIGWDTQRSTSNS